MLWPKNVTVTPMCNVVVVVPVHTRCTVFHEATLHETSEWQCGAVFHSGAALQPNPLRRNLSHSYFVNSSSREMSCAQGQSGPWN